MRRISLLACAAWLGCAAGALAQSGTDPKPKAEDYEVHGQSKEAAIGAEFMIHSFSGQGQTYIAKDYLVVEVAVYPPKDSTFEVKAGRFALRINGKSQVLTPVPAQMAASSLQHPEWQSGPRLEGGVGPVILGRPAPTQVPGGQPPPTYPRVPPPDSGIEQEPRLTAPELLIETALPEGPCRGPVSGFLYFAYRGKTTSIKSLDLLFEDAVLKLR